ncbi:HNH endonuclease signature motif containing protein [Protaetiibacter larvae]|uniref:DUF222 domain-containing protein n=1 Tax=Protaetiibacter larvae TaxID=2592654 RepID=A0A5C1Y8H4_9MICO|nr:HNH endonuclease signature motif containing protein [Protaetiibacter larvae]QEO09940.1 DUF222 domain-containing protein [Protaetiibacter larvae]
MATPAIDLEALRDTLAILGAELPSDSDAAIVRQLDAVEGLGRLVDALRVSLAGEVERRSSRFLGDEGLAARHGCRTGAALVERVTRVSEAEARRRVALGARLAPREQLGAILPPEYPQVAEAVARGELGSESARAIVRQLDQARHDGCPSVDDVAFAEHALVVLARTEPADLVAVHARAWREALDPDGAEPREERLHAQRRFTIGRERDGMTPFSGACDPASAALLRSAFSRRMAPGSGPRFLDAEEVTAAEEGTIGADDPRSREQRDFDVFMGLITAGVRAERDGVGSLHAPAVVTVTITAEELASGHGHGWFDDVAEPVSALTADALACDGGVRRAVLGAGGEVLELGRRDRLFSGAQRHALALRDGGCVWFGCTAPPAWTHAHHVIPWSRGGRTDVANGVLLCAFHHHFLHRHPEYRLRIHDGVAELLSPPHVDPQQQWRRTGRPRHQLTRRHARPSTGRSSPGTLGLG